MGSTFAVSTDQLASASGDIARISADIETQVQAMMGRLNALQDQWQGSASGNFQEVVTQWRGTQRTVKESLDSISRALHEAGEVYATAETNSRALFRRT